MATNLLIGTDINGVPSDAIGVSSNIIRGSVGAGVAVTVTVPKNVDTAFFAYGSSGDFWVDLKETATEPSSPMESSTSELNPVARRVAGVSEISLVCSTINVYQISFYSTAGG